MSTIATAENAGPGNSGYRAAETGLPRGLAELLEKLLRQRESLFEELFAGKSTTGYIRMFLLAIISLSAFYGLTMGAGALAFGVERGILQMLTSAVKVPFLYLVSLAVCFPVLYIILVLMGARLSFTQTLALILLALTLNSVLLSSCAPIVWFFIFTGSNYHFIKLLHVAIFGFSGLWAMLALWQGLRAMCEKSNLYPRQSIRILQIWVCVFGFVGTQMAWSLRPFVGSPDMEYQFFRPNQEGNFYEAIWSSVVNLGKGAQRALSE